MRLQVLRAYPVVTTEQPAFQVSKHQVHDGQIILSQCRVATDRHRHMSITFLGERVVCAHASLTICVCPVRAQLQQNIVNNWAPSEVTMWNVAVPSMIWTSSSLLGWCSHGVSPKSLALKRPPS